MKSFTAVKTKSNIRKGKFNAGQRKSDRRLYACANRTSEKERNRNEEAFVLGDTDNQTPFALDIKEDEDILPTMKMILKDLEERLNGGR